MTSFLSPSIPIYYATETGNAEDVAYFLHLTLSSKGIPNSIHSTSIFDIETFLANKLVLFIVSTSGDGDAPISMQKMWSFFLRKSLPNNLLSGMHVGVFGLGDSSYEKFNATARKLLVRLKQLGATPLLDIGLGDDQSTYGYFTALDAWKSKLIQTLQTNHSSISSSNTEIPSTIDVYEVNPYIAEDDNAIKEEGEIFPSSSFESRLIRNDRITKADWIQDIRLLSFQLPSSDILYRAGDVAVVYYENASNWVNRLLKLYENWFPTEHLPDTFLHITRNKHYPFRENRLPNIYRCTLRQLFTSYLDICAIPKRSSFLSFAEFAHNEEEQAKLIELSSAEGTDLYYDYCIKERRNFVEIFEEFRSLRIPLKKLFEIIPMISPRSYSVASSPLHQHSQVNILSPLYLSFLSCFLMYFVLF
jgi:sulfite reductase alpha subunit-like flavoprotein